MADIVSLPSNLLEESIGKVKRGDETSIEEVKTKAHGMKWCLHQKKLK
jgi:hypothetical protein